ncbi:MAG: SDR family oxidoreductase [Acidimicrobiia bacterium]|nr:SDR family oxidoreductase [Acidimicrobiia bacterium]
MTKLSGAHAIITGGSEGIGLATAEAMIARGARVSLVARSEEKLAAAKASLGGSAETVAADVADADALAEAVGALTAAQGPCDVLVTSAGYSHPGHFMEIPPEEFRRQMEVNFLGTVHATRLVLPSMVERRRGHVCVVSSVAGFLGVFGFTAYSPTKFAVKGFAESLRDEVHPHGVRVSILYPPDTETPGFRTENEGKPEECARISATIKPISAERVGKAVVHGIERNRIHITADPLSAVLLRGVGFLGPVLRGMSDRAVRQVRRERGGGAAAPP